MNFKGCLGYQVSLRGWVMLLIISPNPNKVSKQTYERKIDGHIRMTIPSPWSLRSSLWKGRAAERDFPLIGSAKKEKKSVCGNVWMSVFCGKPLVVTKVCHRPARTSYVLSGLPGWPWPQHLALLRRTTMCGQVWGFMTQAYPFQAALGASGPEGTWCKAWVWHLCSVVPLPSQSRDKLTDTFNNNNEKKGKKRVRKREKVFARGVYSKYGIWIWQVQVWG